MPTLRWRLGKPFVDYRQAGRRHRRTFATREAAEAFLAKLLAGPMTLRRWARAYTDGPGSLKASASDDKCRLRLHLLPVMGDMPLDEIAEATVETYRCSRRGAAAAGAGGRRGSRSPPSGRRGRSAGTLCGSG